MIDTSAKTTLRLRLTLHQSAFLRRYCRKQEITPTHLFKILSREIELENTKLLDILSFNKVQ